MAKKEHKEPKTVKHRGYQVRYQKLGRQRAHGICDWAKQTILIDERQRARQLLDTIIHEHLHRIFPDWSETMVTKTANDLATAIWKMGYRRVELE